MTYPVVTDLADDGIPVKLSCRVLGFSRQAYHAWLANPVSDREWADAHAANAVFDAHADDPEFGYRFLADELRDQGLDVSDHRVLKACRIARVRCCHSIRRGSGKRPGPPVHDDLVRREFTADRPNQLWLTDISEHSTGDGKSPPNPGRFTTEPGAIQIESDQDYASAGTASVSHASGTRRVDVILGLDSDGIVTDYPQLARRLRG